VSSCLLGERVRYDGAHKRAAALLACMAGRVRWLPFCPEVLAGMSVPRPALGLVEVAGDVRARAIEGGLDTTDALRSAAARIVGHLQAEGTCGFVFKSRSPSCGVADAPLQREGEGVVGRATGLADGLVVACVRAALPDLPIASDEALGDEAACTAFLARAAAYAAPR